jgi:uncharacterized protein (TIGR03437 family)
LIISGQTINVKQIARATAVPATRYDGALPPESIGALFGSDLAATTQPATTSPLPISLAGTELRFQDPFGSLLPVPLFYISPGQINFLVPREISFTDSIMVPRGNIGTMSVIKNGELIADGNVPLAALSPGLFMSNPDLLGPPAGSLLRVKASGERSYEPIADYDQTRKRFVPRPIDLGDETESVYLILFGSGIRGRNALGSVSVKFAEVDAPAIYAGPQGDFTGLDQVNVLIPRSLKGRGEVRLVCSAENKPANQGRIAFQ